MIVHTPEVREHSVEMMVFWSIDYREPEYRSGELKLAHHSSLHQDIVIVVPRAVIDQVTVRVQPLPQWRFLCKWNGVRRPRFQPPQSTECAVHISAGGHDRALRNSFERTHEVLCVVIVALWNYHQDDYIRGDLAEITQAGSEVITVSVKMLNAGRKARFPRPAVEHDDVVAHVDQVAHHVAPNETGSTDHQNSHRY